MAKAKEISDFEWVRLAASTDEARPVLTSVHVNGRMEATDGHRLHVAPGEGVDLPEGLYDPITLKTREGTYPQTGDVIPPGAPNVRVDDLAGARAILAAAVTARKHRDYYAVVGVPGGGHLLVNPEYLLDALKGARLGQAEFRLDDGLKPMRVDLGGDRVAVLMPVRGVADRSMRFDISEFTSPIEAA